MRMRFLILIATASFLSGAEVVLLSNGFQMRIDHHEVKGDRIQLFTATGPIEMAATDIAEIEVIASELKLSSGPPKPAIPVKPPTMEQLVEQAAQKHGLPPAFVKLVARAESAYNPKAISNKGAIGIMQLMPDTAAALKVDPHDPAQNTEAGARLLKELLAQYEDYPDQLRRALAAYNAGPGAVEKYNGVPPYRETQAYVQKIVEQYKTASKQ